MLNLLKNMEAITKQRTSRDHQQICAHRKQDLHKLTRNEQNIYCSRGVTNSLILSVRKNSDNVKVRIDFTAVILQDTTIKLDKETHSKMSNRQQSLKNYHN